MGFERIYFYRIQCDCGCGEGEIFPSSIENEDEIIDQLEGYTPVVNGNNGDNVFLCNNCFERLFGGNEYVEVLRKYKFFPVYLISSKIAKWVTNDYMPKAFYPEIKELYRGSQFISKGLTSQELEQSLKTL